MTQATTDNVLAWANEIVKPRYLARFNSNHSFTVRSGRKFHKVVLDDQSVYCFVAMNGDILKAASWAVPAKHVRGNIFSDTRGLEALDHDGFIKYLV